MLILALMLIQDPQTVQCADTSLTEAVAGLADKTQAMDAPGIAALFGDDGQSVSGGRTLTGEAAIQDFLEEFASYRIRSESIEIASVAPTDNGWHVEGRFDQEGTTPEGKDYSAQGRMTIDWRCDAAGWRIKRMETMGG